METPVPSVSRTEIIPASTSTSPPPILKLRLQKKKSERQVAWSENTVDNEHLNRKKSKCCCIYKKPLNFGESSSEEEEECEHCFGHPEKRVKKHQEPDSNQTSTSGQTDTATTTESAGSINCESGSCTLVNKESADNPGTETE